MKVLLNWLLILTMALSLNSCFVNRTTVGNGPVGKTETVRYSHDKQFYLFWGGWALNKANPHAPAECGYQVKSSFNLIDMLVTTLTGGIFSMRTVKILVYKNSTCDPAVQKMERKLEKREMKERMENTR
ncbi:MAG: hypothetical protein JWO06_1150 [Bacteroidota bacterium]|nr:hypothetical protein [Bacteroidota bacterium]